MLTNRMLWSVEKSISDQKWDAEMQVEDSRYSLVWLLLFSGGWDGSYKHVKTVADRSPGGTTGKSSGGRQIGHLALKG
jgi:hypothetical protein